MKLKAVFLDQDGALIPDISADSNEKIELNERFIEGLQLLQSHGYLLVIVSNPSGKTVDLDASAQLEEFKKSIIRSCSKFGIYLDGFYYGPPREGDFTMVSREASLTGDPQADVVLKASGDMDIDLSKSWMIGDIVSDVEAGKKAGCNAVLVADDITQKHKGLVAAKDLADAARKIVKESSRLRRKRSRSMAASSAQ